MIRAIVYDRCIDAARALCVKLRRSRITAVAVHPTEGESHHELYLMCDDVEATITELAAKGITCGPVADRGWGLLTSITLPDGNELGLYEPRHATAIGAD